jgi:hypothetical protein
MKLGEGSQGGFDALVLGVAEVEAVLEAPR